MAEMRRYLVWFGWACLVATFTFAAVNIYVSHDFISNFQERNRYATHQDPNPHITGPHPTRSKEDGIYKIDAKLIPDMLRILEERNAFMLQNSRNYGPVKKQLPKQKKGVIIVTQYRSGSSFLGELFNQHNDAFYTFEPLTMFLSYKGDNTHAEDKVDLLRRILKCDFPDIDTLYKTIDFHNLNLNDQCVRDNFCFRERSRNLCSKELCPLGDGCKNCGPVHLPRVNHMCRSKQMSVMKVIRLYKIEWLRTILEDSSYDLKVIHLVRDPRGIQSSRLKLHPTMTLAANTVMTCDRHWINGIAPLANDSDWLAGKYLRIRYEDLAVDPFKFSSKIYRFAGLKFTPEVKKWITKNTQANNQSKTQWTTNRNSSKTMQSWRKKLSFDTVSLIQNTCAKVMDLYGYKPASNEKELRNLEIPLIANPEL